ncbi:hypothetical protein [Actinoplanes sp. NBRC 103695]|uniref:hypothetical protein n=1 Tax=Actinoplanes sp. NBRC 103695 TaxID=3032202 RepID=UPI002556E9E6|nr:hypothetical protein [Actinoplanes sp. NBRC 103695]
MNGRLAGGVVPPAGRGLWLAGPAGDPVALGEHPAGGHAARGGVAGDRTPPGAPVALGAAGATPDEIRAAVTALANLVSAGGRLAAGADADLGHGFRSALLAGGRGDRRDAMLAALTTDLSALGSREAIVTALFGPRATRRVGAAATAAVADGRWSALRFAAAASDVLGPEQVEQLLALTAPDGRDRSGSARATGGGVTDGRAADDRAADGRASDGRASDGGHVFGPGRAWDNRGPFGAGRVSDGIDPFGPGLASDVSAHLRRLTATVPGPRRLTLLIDLWQAVCAHRVRAGVVEWLRRSQNGDLGKLRQRYHEHDDASAMQWVHLSGKPRPGQLARYTFPPYGWVEKARRLFEDSLAATMLGRVAEAAASEGLAAALAADGEALRVVSAMLSDNEISMSRRPSGLGSRPAGWVREIVRKLDGELTRKKANFIAERIDHARDWGTILIEELREFFEDEARSIDRNATDELRQWGAKPMTAWRAAAGHLSPDRVAGWGQPDPFAEWGGTAQNRVPLADRLAAEPGRAPGEIERIDDFLWMAELADQVARLHGHTRARVDYDEPIPEVHPDAGDEPRPLFPSYASITAAVTSAAQLAEIGGVVPDRPRTWAELVDGLYRSAGVAEALSGELPVPEVLAAIDGTIVPGTGLRVEVATSPRQLASWSAYMGNCLSGRHYAEETGQGRSIVIALRDRDRRIVLNVDLRRRYGGWRVYEIKARFNADPDPAREAAVRAWVATLVAPPPVHVPAESPDLPPPGDRPMRTVRRPTPAERISGEAGPVLRRKLGGVRAPELVRLAHAMTDPPRARGTEAVIALRRASADELDEACRRVLSGSRGALGGPRGEPDGLTLRELWHGTAARPLAAALRRMPPRLAPLAQDRPLQGALRPLARVPEVRTARAVDLVAVRVRASLGRLIAAGDPALARHLAEDPEVPELCAMALAATALGVGDEVRPEPRLVNRAPWVAARDDARELAGRPVPRGRLTVPPEWMPHGWQALWNRAVRAT